MDFKGFRNTGRIFYRSNARSPQTGWYAVVDYCPIAPGHVHIRLDRPSDEPPVPKDFEYTLNLIAGALKEVFTDGWRGKLRKLARQFPSATGKFERCVWYRLGGSDKAFHVHVLPWFKGYAYAANDVLHGRFTALTKGGMLFWLGLAENNKDGRQSRGECANQARYDKLYDLQKLVQFLRQAIDDV